MAHRRSKSKKELGALNVKELKEKVTDIQDHLFQLRMQSKTGQLASSAMLSLARRELARAKTLITQRASAGSAK